MKTKLTITNVPALDAAVLGAVTDEVRSIRASRAVDPADTLACTEEIDRYLARVEVGCGVDDRIAAFKRIAALAVVAAATAAEAPRG